MQPLPQETRLLAMAGRHEVMRAILGPVSTGHPRATATFLEGLALWHQQALSVVLCADDAGSSAATHMLDELAFGVKSLHYDVDVAFPDHRRRGRRLTGLGHFADLRQLCLEGASS